MKVLSLIEPWASLIALGEKKIETRSWKTNYRGPLLIHTSKKIERKILFTEPFYSVLKPIHHEIEPGKIALTFHPGMIIAKCNLVGCLKINENDTFLSMPRAILEDQRIVCGNEFEFGDYTPGRYAWILEDVQPLKQPIPAKGKLGLWEYEGEE